jgi:3'-phosphoadenosine 5'-phosphosulfate (PAPS) 3'-phosphatase
MKADYRIQKMVNSNLRDLWPKLTIIGEEELVGDIQYSKIPSHKIDKEVFPKGCFEDFDEELEVEHACVWVDPLDATLSYTQGHLHEVTTLIGLSYKR